MTRAAASAATACLRQEVRPTQTLLLSLSLPLSPPPLSSPYFLSFALARLLSAEAHPHTNPQSCTEWGGSGLGV